MIPPPEIPVDYAGIPSRWLVFTYNYYTGAFLCSLGRSDPSQMLYCAEAQARLARELTRRFGPEAWKDSRDNAQVPVLGPEGATEC